MYIPILLFSLFIFILVHCSPTLTTSRAKSLQPPSLVIKTLLFLSFFNQPVIYMYLLLVYLLAHIHCSHLYASAQLAAKKRKQGAGKMDMYIATRNRCGALAKLFFFFFFLYPRAICSLSRTCYIYKGLNPERRPAWMRSRRRKKGVVIARSLR